MAGFEKGYFFRLLVSVLLAAAALWLFLLHRAGPPEGMISVPEEYGTAFIAIDTAIDTVLSQFGVRREWITKRNFRTPEGKMIRCERTVVIPWDIPPVEVNLALSHIAQRFGGRAVARENPANRSIVIHIELRGQVVQTLIIRRESGSVNREVSLIESLRSRSMVAEIGSCSPTCPGEPWPISS